MTEEQQTQQQQLKELINVMEKQNVLLAQMLAFMSPVHEFFTSLHLVVRVGTIISGIIIVLYAWWDWIMAHIKH